MGYISPIKIGEIQQMEEGWTDKISRYIAGEVDNLVLESCVKVGCHVDKDELVKALRYDRDQYAKGYADGKRDAASPWHRVEERPDEHTNLWLHDERGNYHVGCISTYRGYTEYIDMDGNTLHDIDYWMPIEPPKEDA